MTGTVSRSRTEDRGHRPGVRRPGIALLVGACVMGLTMAQAQAQAPATAAAGCQVRYAVSSQWSGGFIGDVTLTNLGNPLTSWALTWSFPNGQQVASGWNAEVTQSGTAVTARNVAWNASLATGGSASFGFQATWTGSNAVPAAFALNGVTCTGGTTTGQTTTSTRPTTTTTTRSTTTTGRSMTTTTTQSTTTTTTSSSSAGRTLVVAPNGDDGNAGTLAAPLATIQRAIDLASAGTTVQVRAGTYTPTTNLQILKSGTSSAPITLTAYDGERVVIDGEALPYTPGAVGSTIPAAQRGAIHMQASWWRLAGLEIVHGPYALYCDGCNNNVFDRLVTRDNYETGLQLQGSSSNNQILNLDSYGNRDPRKNGESADGLGIKEGSGSGNVVRGARLWNNVDDGFDAWEFLSPVTVENSVSSGNGVNRWGFSDFAGDGNGFKMGGGDTDPPANHVVRNSMAFSNTAHGFTDNGNPGSITFDHCTAWRNTRTGFDVDSSTSRLTRNLAVSNATAVALGSSSASANSWQVGGTWNDAALLSTDQSTLTGPRTGTGTIPTSPFLRPADGTDVGARI